MWRHTFKKHKPIGRPTRQKNPTKFTKPNKTREEYMDYSVSHWI